MMKIVSLLLLFPWQVWAYVPTVESLFRNGSNPDISANAMTMTLTVRKQLPGDKTTSQVQDASLLRSGRAEDYYKVFISKGSGEGYKISQSRYINPSFSEASLEHKTYYPNFTPYTVKASIEQLERGLFFGTLLSLTFNNGAHLVNYLKTLGVPVRLNNEIINRDKIEQLAAYKRYLVIINRDRNARKTEPNPLSPADPNERYRVNQLMDESMYVDTKQVKLAKDAGEIAWSVSAGAFEAIVSYNERQIQKIRYRSPAGDFEMSLKDYWLANGSHSLPRYIIIKNLSGELYQVEINNFRHYVEKEDDLVKRLKKWDEILRGKESPEFRPEFLL
jgi:hypothetical protein